MLRSRELWDAHQSRSLHSPTKRLKSLLVVNCVMDRTSLDWVHLFKNGLSAVIKLLCVMTIFLFCCSVLNAVVTSAVHSYTYMYSSRCFNLLNKWNLSSLLPVSNSCQSQTELWVHHNVHFYWLYHSPVILFLSSFFLSFFLFFFFLFFLFLFCFYFFLFSFLLLYISFLLLSSIIKSLKTTAV